MKNPRLLFAALALLGLACRLPAAEDLIPMGFTVDMMDRSVSPGTDFAKYAWGGWAAKTEIPADKSRWGTFDGLAENNWRRIHGILEDSAAHPGARGSVSQKVGDFYAAAMDLAAVNAAGLKPIEPELARIDAIRNLDDLARYVADAQAHIGTPLFGLTIYADQKRNDTVILYLNQGGLSLPTRDYYFDEKYAKFRDGLVDHIARMLQFTGETVDASRLHAQTVLALETKLATVSKTTAELRDPEANYHKMSIEDAAAGCGAFPLKVFLTASNLPATEKDVIVAQPEFFEGLGRAIASESLDNWKAYLRWHAVNASASYLSDEVEKESFRFFGTVLNGTPAEEPRWQRVARIMDGQLGFAVGQLYVEKYFPPAVKEHLEGMIANILAILKDRITKLDWMTEPTKQKALAKLATFHVIVGYPEEWRDYSALEVDRSAGFYENVRRAAFFETNRQLAKFGKPFDKKEWLRTPQQVNAYNQPSANQLVFLAGILQPPYFDPAMDDAVNFGAICAVIGHEITHGFDDNGRQYDAHGNLADWWTDEDAKEFKARAQKLIDEYDAIEVLPGLHVNGQQTLGENIADLGGVSMAYEALERSLEGKERKLIDGLTPEQRFFISWAQVWRTKARNDATKRLIKVDVHSPGQVRAYAPLVNLQQFFDAFDIKDGDPMWRKPELRAKIW
ncbi:MAG TPA: M13 family metallopeptidase [Candidatus Didemnitutus sp.]|nr:M13 family metallopeptidase [Candidatus Didemnitutus sp.]